MKYKGKITKSAAIIILLVSLVLPSCATKGQTGMTSGAAVGAVLGQAIGRNTRATLIGTAIGGVLGYFIGNEMDKYDRDQMGKAYEMTPSHQTASWVNPDTGQRYSVTPQPAYQEAGQICRIADVDVVIDGKKQTAKTTACRDNSGNWQIRS